LEENESLTPRLSRTYIESNRNKLPPVVMHKLRKVFPPLGGAPEKVALASLDLHVPMGEVLGLLGKNGAGKTTALNILAGIHSASSGIGLISGYDVETELNSVYERLGNCPQFDCVWKDQSVQRHLEFYASLKGIDDPNAAMDIANAVGLGAPEVYTRQSGALSGGMRRRLSIAVSLLGSPDTLLLDEPTTGLDPSTRIEIWTLLSSFATPERAIIITTHMMLEADALCNRIAIVAKGALKVVGTQVSSILTETLHRVALPLSLIPNTPKHSLSYKMRNHSNISRITMALVTSFN
jgi:ABC-type multidrug transport system ATPase subunit